MEEKRNIKKKNNMIKAMIFVVVMIVLAVCMIFIFREKRTYTIETKEDTIMNSLYCNSENPEDSFFVSPSAIDTMHYVKIIFRNSIPDKFEYDYVGTYSNESAADTARSELHADYNKYMGSVGVYPENLYPIFEYDGAKAKIKLYAEKGGALNSATAKLFYLSTDEFGKLDSYSADDLKTLYGKKGFSCNYNE